MSGADEHFRRVELLVARVEGLDDEVGRETARDVVTAVLDLHAAALARMLELIADASTIGRLAEDEIVGSVLLLHGLHPVSLEARARAALEALGPRLLALRGRAELVDANDGALLVRLVGAEPEVLRSLVEEALVAAVPDASAMAFDTIEAVALLPAERLLREVRPRTDERTGP